jgi:hypothetical protein
MVTSMTNMLRNLQVGPWEDLHHVPCLAAAYAIDRVDSRRGSVLLSLLPQAEDQGFQSRRR